MNLSPNGFDDFQHSQIYKSLNIDIYFQRENNTDLEIYKGGWNTRGEFLGFGILYKMDKWNRDITQFYRGEFFNGRKHGTGIMVKFLGEIYGNLRMKAVVAEFERDKLKEVIHEDDYVVDGKRFDIDMWMKSGKEGDDSGGGGGSGDCDWKL